MTDRPAPLPRPGGADDEIGRPMIRCQWCGSPFRPPKAVGRMPKFCKPGCRQRSFEDRKLTDLRREVSAYYEGRIARLVSSRGETDAAGPLLKPDAGEDVPLW